MKLGILKGFDDRHKHYVAACEDLNIKYEIIDLKSADWINLILKSNCDGFLHMPSCQKQVYKDMYDQKLFFISEVMKLPIYPRFIESYIYESKRGMAYWLEINGFPHAKTYVFYNKKEAVNFVNNRIDWPLYFKTNLGSAAIGVKKIKNKKHATRIINRTFSKNFFYGKGYTKWYHSKKWRISIPIIDDKQHNCVIFQDAVDAIVEWRILKIGDSFFGHQKLNKNGYFSGSGLVGWEKPPEKLLNLIKEVCEKGNFDSMDLDIFEDKNGRYWINEMQTIFGSYNQSQMYIDNVPGRFVFNNGKWIFEEGYFNKNYSCNLRVNSFVDMLKNEKV